MADATRFDIAEVTTVDDELVDAFARLIPQLSSPDVVPSREMLRDIVAAPATTLLVARDRESGRIVGSAALAVFRVPTGVRAWIEDVVVDEPMRRRGLGEALTLEAIRRARDQGAPGVELTSRPSREAANRLYQRIGFAIRRANLYHYTT
jgi:ribosomal protein S18 acetylase RimI-like enzyme